MDIIIICLYFIAAIFIGLISYTYSRERKKNTEIKEKENIEISNEKKNISRLIVIKDITIKEKVLIGLLSLATTAVFIYLLNFEISILEKVKLSVMALILMATSIIDGKCKIIPNKLVLITIGVRTVIFIPECICNFESFKEILLSSIISLVVCCLIFLLLSFVSKGGFGMGDVKMISAQGYMTSATLVFASLVIGMFVCMFYCIYLLVIKKMNRKDSVPYGPFIFIGYLISIVLRMF